MPTTADDVTVVVVIAGKEKLPLPIRFLFNSRIGVIQTGELAGQLVMPFWNRRERFEEIAFTSGKPSMQALPYYPYRDIFWLYRALMHSRDSYGRTSYGEFERLHKAIAVSRELHSQLLSLRSGAELEEHEKELHALIASVMLYLNPRVRQQAKQEGFEKVAALAKLKDARGRGNVSALAARMVAIRNRLSAREDGMTRISSVYALRKTVLSSVITAFDFQVNATADFFEQLLREWPSICVMEHRQRTVAHHLAFLAKSFEDIDVQPFRATFRHATGECLGIVSALNEQRFDAGRLLAVRSATGFSLRKLRSDLEIAMFDLSKKKHFPDADVDLAAILRALENANSRFHSLDTGMLTDFNRSVTDVYLSQAIDYLKRREVPQAHESLQQALVLL